MTLPAGAALGGESAKHGSGEGFSPAKVIQVELTTPLPRLDADGSYRRAWVLARLHTEPIGACVVPLPDEGVSACELAALLWRELSEPIAGRFAAAGLPVPAALPAGGLAADPEKWPFRRERAAILSDPPFMSVVIPTRDRPDQLTNLLQSLDRQKYPRFEIVVVDNAPTSDAVERIVKDHAGNGAAVRYCVEPRPGASRARNAGISAAAGDIIAFADDDDEPDEYWLAGVASGFRRSDRIGAVTGMIVPARLDTAAEELFEIILGGHVRDRGFVPDTFSPSGPQSPLFPLPPFGSGANMAFRRAALDKVGGFDVAMGPGTPAVASEDTLLLTLTLLAGYDIAYEPAALMWHHHRSDMEGLTRQLHGYSVGLTAFYTALLRHRPSVIPGLLKLLPAALGYLKGAVTAPDGTPDPAANLDRRQLRGMLSGPPAYIRSALAQRRSHI